MLVEKVSRKDIEHIYVGIDHNEMFMIRNINFEKFFPKKFSSNPFKQFSSSIPYPLIFSQFYVIFFEKKNNFLCAPNVQFPIKNL